MLQEASADLTNMAMGGNTARQQGDEQLLVKFYRNQIKDDLRSREEGRPIFKEVDFVHIMIPGNKDSIIDRPARQSDFDRFPEHYRKYKAREEQTEFEGMPIGEWPGVTRSQAEELRYINIYTVEQLANCADNHLSSIMGGPVLKQKAAKYLEVAKDNQAAEQLLLVQHENQALKERLDEMAATIQALKEETPKPRRRGRPPKNSEE